MLDGGHPGPLLSDALEHWFKVRGGLGIDQKKVDTDYNRVKDFIEFAGDKPINKYRYLDFQSFANLLARVPASVKPDFRGMTQAEAVEHNDRLPPDEQHKTLTAKTIETNYISPLNMIFHDMCAHHGFPSPLANVTVRISAGARDSTDRQPFTVSELNKWFAYAAKEDRGDNKWLPLLGKVGVTNMSVEQRIAGARLQSTYLLADVEIVAAYKLFNINRTKLEHVLHRALSPARLDLTIKDRFGNPVKPEEWYLVPLHVIDEVVERVKDGSITEYEYDPAEARLRKHHQTTE